MEGVMENPNATVFFLSRKSVHWLAWVTQRPSDSAISDRHRAGYSQVSWVPASALLRPPPRPNTSLALHNELITAKCEEAKT